ncbi:class I SAM-dependent methyltransferase [Cellulomonas sp.]|uniref:class I SAM-dependent methyltransferase n=1 Tax=Cellulomonas sp. TaxID=40001 RepID=UPI00258BA053|nr:class I SAM-dependent methyltransferase [Cellulomonas sp.]MCR6690662.1 class I SAM-dependent methyltransferase [Cellulomonas sp.]
MDFHDPANARTYSGRDADPAWGRTITSLLDPTGWTVVDVGCGGGVYSRAWLGLGASSVIGVDSSVPILQAARADAPAGLVLRKGDATATGLPDGRHDVVFARALVHHVPDLQSVVAEAHRLLRLGGRYLVQDRTMGDVDQPGSPEHPRGWFFEVHPRLREIEAHRRPDDGALRGAMAAVGLSAPVVRSLWEVRRHYPGRDSYLADVSARTGRSLLHELDDDELVQLVAELRRRLPDGPVVEQDRWTLWCATRST